MDWQFPIDKDAKLNLLRLSFDDGHGTSSVASNCGRQSRRDSSINQDEELSRISGYAGVSGTAPAMRGNRRRHCRFNQSRNLSR